MPLSRQLLEKALTAHKGAPSSGYTAGTDLFPTAWRLALLRINSLKKALSPQSECLSFTLGTRLFVVFVHVIKAGGGWVKTAKDAGSSGSVRNLHIVRNPVGIGGQNAAENDRIGK